METANSLQDRVSTERYTPVFAEHQAPASAGHGATWPMRHGSGSTGQSWLAKRRGWIVIALLTVAGIGLALGAGWVTVATLLPLLFILPCMAMMVMCMKGMNQQQGPTAGQTSAPVPPPTSGDTQK